MYARGGKAMEAGPYCKASVASETSESAEVTTASASTSPAHVDMKGPAVVAPVARSGQYNSTSRPGSSFPSSVPSIRKSTLLPT
jgi:hypothetical protein